MDNLKDEIQKFFETYQGAKDLRSPEEKSKDFLQTEFVAEAAPIVWVEKKPEEFRSFPVLNQNFTSKCVAFTTAKLALINYWLKTKEFLLFSPNSIYDYRANKPEGGMVGNDAFEIWEKNGISLEAVARSNQMLETEKFDLSLFSKEVAKGFKLGNYITIPAGDFDRVASTIQATGKGVMCWFYFTHQEWSTSFPRIISSLDNPYVLGASRHSVTAVDFGLINGEQFIKIEDSAHFGDKNVRFITREFFNKRNFLAKYPMNFNYEDPIVPPPASYVFTKTLKFGDKDTEVKQLQLKLQQLGFYPNNLQTDIYFGNITRKSVQKFQTSRGLLADGVVGVRTREELNK